MLTFRNSQSTVHGKRLFVDYILDPQKSKFTANILHPKSQANLEGITNHNLFFKGKAG